MRFGPVGIWEILVIVGVALLIFGPTQLPKIARGVGKAFKSAKDLKDEVTGAVLDDEPPKRTSRSPESRADAESRVPAAGAGRSTPAGDPPDGEKAKKAADPTT